MRRRLASALVLVPLALLGAVLGSPLWNVFVALFGAVMAWEWSRICNRGQMRAPGLVVMLTVLAALAAATLGAYRAAFLVLLSGALAAVLIARLTREAAPGWQGAGAVYIGIPCVAILWIRADPEAGLGTLIWLLALVWAADTGAYLAGRRLGGPKMASRISPNKTWAGLGGAVLSAALVGLAAALWLGTPAAWLLVAVSAALGLVEQVGDLAESVVKRRFGVKNSSEIIPGHGGVLDRVDGLMAVSVAVAGLSLVGDGSVLLWR